MNILVCISQVPDTTTKITFSENNTKFNENGVQFIINPYDEYALTRAIEIKEKLGGKVTVINVGKSSTEPNLRKALAIGADEAIRVDAEPADAYYVAFQVAQHAKGFDMILCGKESIDHNGGLVPSMIGELLGIPSINVAVKLDIEGNTAIMEHELDGGKEIIECPMPFVAGCQKPICEPRIPNMRGIMTAKNKPLLKKEPVSVETLTHVTEFLLPKPKESCRMIIPDEAEKLIDILQNEVKVI
ncbi:MAG: electron transfer flavoprotein subunit alpha [Bacteroidetes bacterium RIFCSPLOWO2_02_FULL_36_8]|nr:MAG: electron transfer flavoprotein subunit alpha [Bacteroidetes bacterium RIFCSPLOWO2_02_FULL_36_8]OFY70681.1 MAG: electron transfer flavoprotein subunit alpha [Bacteroidetes bacterium RIFCSPLOWO2_12_FULL_37_12]